MVMLVIVMLVMVKEAEYDTNVVTLVRYGDECGDGTVVTMKARGADDVIVVVIVKEMLQIDIMKITTR